MNSDFPDNMDTVCLYQEDIVSHDDMQKIHPIEGSVYNRDFLPPEKDSSSLIHMNTDADSNESQTFLCIYVALLASFRWHSS